MHGRVLALLDSRFLTRVGNVNVLLQLLVLGALILIVVIATAVDAVPVSGWIPVACFVAWLAAAIVVVSAWRTKEHREQAIKAVARFDHPPLDQARVATDEWSQRALLAQALAVAYHDGLRWYRIEPQPSDLERWQSRTRDLILSALGEEVATRFMSDWRRDEQILRGLDARVQHLWDLYQRVDSVAPLALLPDFKGEDWVSKR